MKPDNSVRSGVLTAMTSSSGAESPRIRAPIQMTVVWHSHAK
jgi:hypothetical protein